MEGFADRQPSFRAGKVTWPSPALAVSPSADPVRRADLGAGPAGADGILASPFCGCNETQVSYLFITHDIHYRPRHRRSVAVMFKGRLQRFGPKSRVLSPPLRRLHRPSAEIGAEMRLGLAGTGAGRTAHGRRRKPRTGKDTRRAIFCYREPPDPRADGTWPCRARIWMPANAEADPSRRPRILPIASAPAPRRRGRF